MNKRTEHPEGKIFRFTEEALKTDKLEAGVRYLCSKIINERIVMSAGGGTDNQESGIFMRIDDNNIVDFKNPIEATTNWWSTEVRLFEDCVVGEVEINTYVEYNVLNSDNKVINKLTTTKPSTTKKANSISTISLTEALLESMADMVEKQSEFYHFNLNHVEKYLETLLGKRASVEESQKLVNMINSHLDKNDKLFSVVELNRLFVRKPLVFSSIAYLLDTKSTDHIDVEEFETENKHTIKNLREEIDALNKETIFVTNQFDFTLREKQIDNAKIVIENYNMPKYLNDIIEEVLTASVMLYMESFDGSISDTAPRDVMRHIGEKIHQQS